MIGISRITGERIENLDPSNDSDLYYQLDTREWRFVEEFTNPVIAIVEGWRDHIIESIPILTLSDLLDVHLSKIGHFIFRKNVKNYGHYKEGF
uniref:Uncharacterized protein n=1 Tax=viral metagenome TaxID=1070528 RepID=A0A6M3ISY1_9ZZZZ